MLGYIIAGFLTGPNFVLFPAGVNQQNITIWGEIGVIFLLFSLGLEFSFGKLKSVGKTALVAACTEITSFFLLGYLGGRILGWRPVDCLFWGLLLSMSSTTIVIKAFDDLHLRQEPFTNVVFGLLIVEDLIGIVVMVVLSTLSGGEMENGGLAVVQAIAKLVFFLILWGVGGVYLLPTLFKRIRPLLSDEVELIVSLGFCLSMVVLCAKLGFSSALGAFVTGSLISATMALERLEKLIKPLQYLFGAVFFVSIGMLVKPGDLLTYAVPILLALITVYLGKIICTGLGIFFSGQCIHTAVLSGFSMTQIGEFSMIAAAEGVNLGILDGALYPIIVAVAVLTTVTTPLFMKVAEPAYALLIGHLPDFMLKAAKRYTLETQDTEEQDSAWKNFLHNYFVRLGIYGTLCIAVCVCAWTYVAPFFARQEWGRLGGYAAGLMTLMLLAPFLRMLITGSTIGREAITTLWFRKRTNHLPLLFLLGFKVVLALCFIYFTLTRIMELPQLLALAASLLLAYGMGRSDWLMQRYLKLETNFMINLNSKQIAKRRAKLAEQGLSADNEVIDAKIFFGLWQVDNVSSCAGRTLQQLAFRQVYGFNVLQIQRKSGSIDFPGGEEAILSGDVLLLVGTKQQLQTLGAANKSRNLGLSLQMELLNLQEYLVWQEKLTEDERFWPCAIHINPESELVQKTIKTSDLRRQWDCLAVALERSGYAMVNPHVSLVLEEGDLLWVLGKRRMLHDLIREGIL